MDTLFITDLRLKMTVGTKPRERIKPQTLLVDMEMTCDLARAGRSDSLKDAVNYNDIAKAVRARFRKARPFLIERVAEEIASICLSDPRVMSATVTVRKPGALPFARNAGVRLTRSRGKR